MADEKGKWVKIERGIVMRDGRYYVRFQVGGKTVTEVTSARTLVQARAARAIRQGLVSKGLHVPADKQKVTIGQLLDALLENWQARQIAGLASATCQLETVRKAFGTRRARDWRYSDAEKYVLAGTSPADKSTRSARMGILRTAMKLAMRDDILDRVPPFPPRVDNVRQGYLRPEEFEAQVAHFEGLDAEVYRFLYASGQRVRRVLELQSADVDTVHWRIAAEPARGNKGRPMVPLTGEARRIIEHRLQVNEARVRAGLPPCTLIFHREGQPISHGMIWSKWYRSMRKQDLTWTLHDFRRSAYINLVNAGVDPLVAVRIIGHKTLVMANRYLVQMDEAMHAAIQERDDYIEKRLAMTGTAHIPAHRGAAEGADAV